MQSMVSKTLHTKTMIEQHEPHAIPHVNSGASEQWTIPAPLVAPIVLLILTIP